jgi:hypothetical protein
VARLSRLTYPNYVPVVVDNASRDDSVAALRSRYPDLAIIENPRNLGYAGGNNVGIRWALAHGADYVQIINSDTEATPEMITALVDVAESDPRIAVVGCRNVLMEDPTRLWGAYGLLTYGPFVVRTAGQGSADGSEWRVVRDADWVIGNGYLWRRAALESIGLLDEQFFGYHEDVDWCLRARQAGYRVVYAGTAAIVHRGASSSDDHHTRSFPASYFLGRNGVLLVRKHGRPRERVRFAVLCGAALAARWLRALLLQLLPRHTRARARAASLATFEARFSRGVLDAIRHRPIPFARLGMSDAVDPAAGPGGVPRSSGGVSTAEGR